MFLVGVFRCLNSAAECSYQTAKHFRSFFSREYERVIFPNINVELNRYPSCIMTRKIFRSNFSHRQSDLFAFLGHHHPLTIIFVFQAEIDKTTNAGGKYRIDKRLVSTSIVNIDEIVMLLQSASTM